MVLELSEPGDGLCQVVEPLSEPCPVVELGLATLLNWENFFRMDCRLLHGAAD